MTQIHLQELLTSAAAYRYKLPVVVLVFNNGGIYGGDRRPDALRVAAQQGASSGGFSSDPIPTAFAEQTRRVASFGPYLVS